MKKLNKPMQENCKEPLTPLTDAVKQSLNEIACVIYGENKLTLHRRYN